MFSFFSTSAFSTFLTSPFSPSLDTAAPEQAAGSGLLTTVVMIGLFGLMFYFMLYRPQKKQEKQILEMRNNIKVGDEISTTGGIIGKVIQIKDDFLVIENGADRTKIRIAKWAVRAIEVAAESDDDDDDDDE